MTSGAPRRPPFWGAYSRRSERHCTEHARRGSIVASNYIYNVAPQDGLVLGLMNNAAAFERLLGVEETKFDSRKINWLGSPTQTPLLSWYAHGACRIAGRCKGTEVTFGASSLNGTEGFYVRIFNDVFKTKFRMILGYPGLSEVMLAMERGEVDGTRVHIGVISRVPNRIGSVIRKYLFNTEASVILSCQTFHLRTTSPRMMRIARCSAHHCASCNGLSVLHGPAVPRERVMAIRKAFADTFMDSSFLADAASQNLDIAPISGEDVEKTLQDTYAIAAVLRRLRRLYNATIRSELGIVDFRPATVLRFSD